MTPISDITIIEAFLGGDEAAFDSLIDRYKHKVHRMILGLVGDIYDAEELTQDVFVIVFSKLHTFKKNAAFSTWLYTVVQNKVKNYWIRKKIRQTLSLDWLMETTGFDLVGDTEKSTEATMEEKERIAAVTKGLDSLPLKWRQVLTLRELNEMSYDDIAGVLKCSVGTVKSRLFRAKEKLKAVLETSSHSKEVEWPSKPLSSQRAIL
jgi:RNA polymerase sigma-70 factor (ECF subfamily)